jgi:hypothetical protein
MIGYGLALFVGGLSVLWSIRGGDGPTVAIAGIAVSSLLVFGAWVIAVPVRPAGLFIEGNFDLQGG